MAMARANLSGPTRLVPMKISEVSCERAVYYSEIIEPTLPYPLFPSAAVVNPYHEPERDTSQSIIDTNGYVDAGSFIRGQEIGRPTRWFSRNSPICSMTAPTIISYLGIQNLQIVRSMELRQTLKENVKHIYIVVKCVKLMTQREDPVLAKMAYEVLDEEGSILQRSNVGVFDAELRSYHDGVEHSMLLGTKQELQTNRDNLIKDGVLRIKLRMNIYKDLSQMPRDNSADVGEPLAKRRRVENPMEGLKGALDSLISLWQTREESGDITINCEGESFKAHKFILCRRSEVFKKMFSSSTGMKETKTMEFTITDIHAEIFKAMMEYLYVNNDFIQFDWSNVDHLCAMIYAAEKYAIMPLKIRCFQKLMKIMNLENFAKIAKVTFLYDCEKEFKDEVRHFYESHQITLNSVQTFRKFAQEDFESFYKLFFHCLSIK